MPVSVVSVSQGEISSYLRLNAIIEPEKDIDVYPKTAGLITSIRVEEGDQVKTGAILLTLDSDEQMLSLERAEAAAERQRAALSRAEKLYSQEMLTEEEYERQKLAVKDADINVRQANLSLEYTSVVAPFSGMIAMRQVDIGDRVSPARALFKLVDRSSLRANCWVANDDLKNLYTGLTAKVRSETCEGKELTARILRISPIIDPQYGKVKVTFAMDGDQNSLKPGEFVELMITTRTKQDVLVIPKRAVIYEAGSPAAYIAVDSFALHRKISLGLETSDMVEVMEGLSEGERIIIEGQTTLKDSALIRIVDRENPVQ